MLDIGWSEMLLIAAVAIVVIGPKDLPKALRTAGKWMQKARSMAREFQNSIDDMVRESELEELRKTSNSIANFDAKAELEKQLDPTGGDAPLQQASASPAENTEPAADPEPVDPYQTPASGTVAPAHSLSRDDTDPEVEDTPRKSASVA